MAFSIAIAESRHGVRLTGNLDIAVAEMFDTELFRQLNVPLPCEIDLSGIEGIDEAGIELLLTLKESGLVDRFIRHSNIVLEALGQFA